MRLMNSDLDARGCAFKRLVEIAGFYLAGTYPPLDVGKTPLVGTVQIGVAVWTRIAGTADRNGQRMTRVVFVVRAIGYIARGDLHHFLLHCNLLFIRPFTLGNF